eukprot:m.5149 g.5149  ORF g.5149 m.5149 type:complete len:97 (-) comp4144_c0_seq1:2309-2599(-)
MNFAVARVLTTRAARWVFLPATIVVGAVGVYVENQLSSEEDKEKRSAGPVPAWQRRMDEELTRSDTHETSGTDFQKRGNFPPSMGRSIDASTQTNP